MSIQELQKIISKKFDNSVLESIIKLYGINDEIEVVKIDIEQKRDFAGDSYLSIINRFTISAKGKTGNDGNEIKEVFIPVIVKCLPDSLGRRKTFRSSSFFRNEIVFYEKVFPALVDFAHEHNLGKEVENIIPKLLYSVNDGKNDFIALEDLSYKKFTSADRSKGLSQELTIGILQVFAKVHGTSLAMETKYPQKFGAIKKELIETYFAQRYYPWYAKFQKLIVEILTDSLRKELPEEYADKFQALIADNFYEKTCALCDNAEGPLCAITQGDAWIPNFLFQNEGNSTNIVMIDFQLARYASICNDIVFFLLVCVEEKDLIVNWDTYLNEYRKELNRTISSLGGAKEFVSAEELEKEVNRTIVFAIAMCMEALPMSLVEGFDPDEAIKGDDKVDLTDVWRMKPFENQEDRKRIASTFKFIIDKWL